MLECVPAVHPLNSVDDPAAMQPYLFTNTRLSLYAASDYIPEWHGVWPSAAQGGEMGATWTKTAVLVVQRGTERYFSDSNIVVTFRLYLEGSILWESSWKTQVEQLSAVASPESYSTEISQGFSPLHAQVCINLVSSMNWVKRAGISSAAKSLF